MMIRDEMLAGILVGFHGCDGSGDLLNMSLEIWFVAGLAGWLAYIRQGVWDRSEAERNTGRLSFWTE